MTDAEIKKLVYQLKYLHVGRDDSIAAAKLIEAAYIGPRFHHKKRGTNYTMINGGVRLQISRTDLLVVEENGEKSLLEKINQLDGMFFTLYRGEDGVYSARHPAEFSDGRFEPLKDG